MGGDAAPSVVIEGAGIARERYPDARFLFFGRKDEVEPLLAAHKDLAAVSQVVHCDDIVRDSDKPGQALRKSRESSMARAIAAVKAGEADVAVSAGNTGALMALAKFILRTLPGIDRPALASLLPTLRGESIMLDLGANVDCASENLVEFAIMGSAFARAVLELDNPVVGLLNIGEEDLKGNDKVRRAAEILRSSSLHLDFAGFVEGDKISQGVADVVVTDGFTGNIALKSIEGTARLIVRLLAESYKSTLLSRFGYLLSRPGLRGLRTHLDPNNHNGAVMLGLNGMVVKSHGSATATGFATAIGVAVDMARHRLIDLITDDLTGIVLDDEPASDDAPGGPVEDT